MTIKKWIEKLESLTTKDDFKGDKATCGDFTVGIECCGRFIELTGVNISYLAKTVSLESVKEEIKDSS